MTLLQQRRSHGPRWSATECSRPVLRRRRAAAARRASSRPCARVGRGRGSRLIGNVMLGGRVPTSPALARQVPPRTRGGHSSKGSYRTPARVFRASRQNRLLRRPLLDRQSGANRSAMRGGLILGAREAGARGPASPEGRAELPGRAWRCEAIRGKVRCRITPQGATGHAWPLRTNRSHLAPSDEVAAPRREHKRDGRLDQHKSRSQPQTSDPRAKETQHRGARDPRRGDRAGAPGSVDRALSGRVRESERRLRSAWRLSVFSRRAAPRVGQRRPARLS